MIKSIQLPWVKMNSLDDLLKVGNSILLIKHPDVVDLDFNPNGILFGYLCVPENDVNEIFLEGAGIDDYGDSVVGHYLESSNIISLMILYTFNVVINI